MKKILVGMMAIATIFATSCEKDLGLDSSTEKTSMVSFQVGTPEIATRAYSDGQTATVLQYAVYDADGKELTDLTVTDAEIHGSTTVNLQLTTGDTYSVIFWAASPEAPYTIDFDAKTITVDYTNAVSNDENRDAFYKYHTFTVKGTQTETIELKRPFAQLNIGTNDFDASASAGYKPEYSNVKVSVSSELNFVNGEVNEAEEVEFKLAAIPTSETFPVSGYEYISMNYLLVGADKSVVDVTFGYSENSNEAEKTRVVGSVPVQRNHRTNIYGQLLTSNVDINVEIKPDYDDEDLPETLEEKLSIAAQLGGTVTLTEDVELSEPLVISGVDTRASAAPIAVEIDLNGYNMTYTSDIAAHSAMITVNSGNKLVIKDSKGNGKISYTYTGEGDPNFGWGTYTIANYGGNLVIENGTIEIISSLNENSAKHMYSAIWQYSGSTTVNGGTISNPTYRSARLWKGNMTINGGTFEGQLWVQPTDNSSVLTINGGDFAPRGIDGSSVFVTNDSYNPTLKVTGGTFETRLGCTDYTKDGVKGSVSGGIFGVEPDSNLIADGYKAEKSGEKWAVVEDVIEDVAVVGNADDLKTALESLVAGNLVVLDKDIDLTGVNWEVSMPWQGSATDVAFDGNGHKIIGLSTNGLQGGLLGKYNSNGNITIKNLTLENVAITGTNVDGESAGGALIGWIENHGAGTITIENVKVNGIKAEGFKYIGGLIGYNNGNVAMHLIDCSVTGTKDSYLNSTYNEGGNYKGHIGGLLGLWMKGSLTNCEVKDLVIKHGTTDMSGSSNRAGALVGTKYAGVEVVSAIVDNVTVDGVAASETSLFGPNASNATNTDKSNVTIK